MVGAMTFSLLAALGTLIGLVAWIGWRYFLQPHVSAGGTPADTRPVTTLWRPGNALDTAEVCQAQQRPGFPSMEIRLLAHGSLWFACALVGMAVASVFAMSGRISLEPLAALDFGRQEHIQLALNHEKLVPPQPLPPSVFVGTDRPGLETADRDWTKLNPDFARLALQVFARAQARGFPMVLLEGYRSPERQDVLADSGAHVTSARAFQSKHQYGQALDAAPMKDGRLVISERDPWAMEAYRVLGEEAERAGLVWGGRWKLKDFGHIEAPQSVAAIARRN